MGSRSPDRDPAWVVVRSGDERRWGGEIRRQEIFSQLARSTGATVLEGWPAFRDLVVGGRVVRLARQLGLELRPSPPRALVAAEQVPVNLLQALPAAVAPVAVAIYDDHSLQAEALGVALPPDRVRRIRQRLALNCDRFPWLVVPTASFADLIGLEPARVIVGGNGTVTGAVAARPFPDRPAVGLVSGAAPGRGIETLIEAVRGLRRTYPELRLLLWLIATGSIGEAYLTALRSSTADDPWIVIDSVPYSGLSDALAEATVLTIPTPASTYSDVALPVKLFDSMAAGRPLVVTPRRETAAVVTRHGVGIVTGGDEPDDLAAALGALLGDAERTRAIGTVAREVAERVYDWEVVGRRIADEVLRREGLATSG